MTLTAASCFSGIGAPELGGPQFDWKFCAEIEKFPAAVLAKRFPHSINLGDVTADDFMQRATSFGRLDLLVGGPPCQAFSVAGLRKSMGDDRGNLSLRFVKIAHAIRPRNLLVENVPGWLNTPDNAFGCFLGAILGHDDALHSPLDGKWPRVGMASGPLGRLCWATVDAQFFGVAQRRRRVFVVVDFGDGADPAKVLFEPEGLCRNPPSRGQAGEGTAHDLAPSLTSSGRGVERGGESRGQDPVIACAEIAPTLDSHFGDKQGLEDQHINGGGDCSLPPVSLCLNHGAQQRLDPTFETLIPVNRCDFDVAHTLKGEGFDAYEDGTGRGTPIVPVHRDIAPTLTGNYGKQPDSSDTNAGPMLIPVGCFDDPRRFNNIHGGGDHGDLHPTLESTNPKQIIAAQVEPFVMMERGRDGGSNLEYRQDGTANAILTPNGGRGGMGVGAIAFSSKDSGSDATDDLSPTLRSMSHSDSHANGGGQVAVAIQAGALRENPNSGPDGIGVQSDIAYTLEDRCEVQAVGFAQNQRDEIREMEVAGALAAEPGMKQTTYVHHNWQVRRLTPTECERLQGFPDGFTNVEYRGKPAADGPRYKALGNSWAVPCGAWILARIAKGLEARS